MRIALTTDWLVTEGGAERVIREFCALWSDAPIFTTVHRSGCLSPHTERIVTSRLQPWYRGIKNHRILLPFMPRAVETWDLRGFDAVVSSSHAVAKGCLPPSNAVHVCYCHTPMRYAWEMEEEYLDDFRLWGPLRALVRHELAKLRAWDLTTAKRVDQFVANSHAVAERIQRIYGRESIVLPPPVDERFFGESRIMNQELGWRKILKPDSKFLIHDSFLAVGRLVPYKRFDLLIEAANAAKFPLKIVGEGPDERRLKHLAGSTVSFLGHVPDEELPALYQSARALLFPVHEDAGVVPLEAMASGTPVIALKKGGALDTVMDDVTGIFFDEQTVPSLLDAMKKFETMRFDADVLREHARQFSSVRFRERMRKIVERVMQR